MARIIIKAQVEQLDVVGDAVLVFVILKPVADSAQFKVEYFQIIQLAGFQNFQFIPLAICAE